jgi:hypothetical protein
LPKSLFATKPVLKLENQGFCAGKKICPYDWVRFKTTPSSAHFQTLMPMQTIVRTSRATVHNGLTGLASGLARSVWLLVSLVSFAVLILLAVFFWHRYQIAPCDEYDGICVVTATWMASLGVPGWVVAGLHVLGLLLPSLVWMALGVSIALSSFGISRLASSSSRRVWLWLISLMFMVF